MFKPILLVTTLAASAAVAQPPATAPEPAEHSAPSDAQNAAHDAGEMICISQSTIGSRLTRRRTCATREQWLQQRRMDRLYTEKAQTTRVWPGQ